MLQDQPEMITSSADSIDDVPNGEISPVKKVRSIAKGLVKLPMIKKAKLAPKTLSGNL
jgi:hypothetical protein